MRNVVVVAIDRERYAVELRWVQEIVVLPHLTPVPTAPPSIAGAINHKGTIVPVLSARALVGRRGAGARAPRPGDAALLVSLPDQRIAIAVDRIDEVTTLEARDEAGHELKDARGAIVPSLDPRDLYEAARRQLFGGAGT